MTKNSHVMNVIQIRPHDKCNMQPNIPQVAKNLQGVYGHFYLVNLGCILPVNASSSAIYIPSRIVRPPATENKTSVNTLSNPSGYSSC